MKLMNYVVAGSCRTPTCAEVIWKTPQPETYQFVITSSRFN